MHQQLEQTREPPLSLQTLKDEFENVCSRADFKTKQEWLERCISAIKGRTSGDRENFDSVGDSAELGCLHSDGNHIVIALSDDIVLRWSVHKAYDDIAIDRWFPSGGKHLLLTSNISEIQSCFCQLLELTDQPHHQAINASRLGHNQAVRPQIRFLLWKRYSDFDFVSKLLQHGDTIQHLDRISFALGLLSVEGEVHQDVKPANFLRSGDHELVLSDHDTTIQLGGSFEMVGGTPDYGFPGYDKPEWSRCRDSVAFAKSYLHIRLGPMKKDLKRAWGQTPFDEVKKDLEQLAANRHIEAFEYVWLCDLLNPMRGTTRNARFDWLFLKRLSQLWENNSPLDMSDIDEHMIWYHVLSEVFQRLVDQNRILDTSVSYQILKQSERDIREWLEIPLFDWDCLSKRIDQKIEECLRSASLGSEESKWAQLHDLIPVTVSKVADHFKVLVTSVSRSFSSHCIRIVLFYDSDKNLHDTLLDRAYESAFGKWPEWLKHYPTLGPLSHLDVKRPYFKSSNIELFEFPYPRIDFSIAPGENETEGAAKDRKEREEDLEIKGNHFNSALLAEVYKADIIVFSDTINDTKLAKHLRDSLKTTNIKLDLLPKLLLVADRSLLTELKSGLPEAKFHICICDEQTDLLDTVEKHFSELLLKSERNLLRNLIAPLDKAQDSIQVWYRSSHSTLFSDSFHDLLAAIAAKPKSMPSEEFAPIVEQSKLQTVTNKSYKNGCLSRLIGLTSIAILMLFLAMHFFGF